MEGTILGDRYQIIGLVGIGGMAKVYKALDRVLNRYVAIKILKEEYMEDEDFLKKFAMEAQSAASLTHSNIVSVYDVGSSFVDGKRHNYIVMEFVDGKTLKDIIDSKDYLDIHEITNYGIQICQALECAHRNGIIHRDIKPHNILIDKNGNLKVTDFGIARISSSATITYTSTVLGTVHYISPEQAKGKFIDEKSDLYSLGVVLYEMATGTVPYDAANAVGIALKHIQEPLIEPKELRHDLPKGLNAIIKKAMEKDPEDRFQNASALKEALADYEHFAIEENGDYPQKDTDVTSSVDEGKAVYTTLVDYIEENEEKRSKFSFKKFFVVLIMLAVLCGGAIIGGRFYFRNQQKMTHVPALVGLEESVAKKQTEQLGLVYHVKDRKQSTQYEAGIVIETSPKSNQRIGKGETVNVVVSSGKTEVTVPNLTNMTLENAESTLIKNNLTLGKVRQSYSDQFQEGKIIKQDPNYGKKITIQSEINVTVSLGPSEQMIEMTNLIGLEESKAIERLENSGLNVGSIEYRKTTDYDPGVVIWQQYEAGTSLKQGTSVNLIVNSKEPASHIYEFTIPLDESITDEYNIRITKVTENGEEDVYNANHSPEEGDVTLRLTEPDDTHFRVYVDGELVKDE